MKNQIWNLWKIIKKSFNWFIIVNYARNIYCINCGRVQILTVKMIHKNNCITSIEFFNYSLRLFILLYFYRKINNNAYLTEHLLCSQYTLRSVVEHLYFTLAMGNILKQLYSMYGDKFQRQKFSYFFSIINLIMNFSISS